MVNFVIPILFLLNVPFFLGIVTGSVSIILYSNRREILYLYEKVKQSKISGCLKIVTLTLLIYNYILNTDPLLGISRRVSSNLAMTRFKTVDGRIYTQLYNLKNDSDLSRYYLLVSNDSELHQYFGCTRIDITPFPGSEFPKREDIPDFLTFERVGTAGESTFFKIYEELENEEPLE